MMLEAFFSFALRIKILFIEQNQIFLSDANIFSLFFQPLILIKSYKETRAMAERAGSDPIDFHSQK